MDIQRDLYLSKLVERRHNGMVKIITGMRRSGKSYLLFRIFVDYLRREGVDEDHIVQIDLEDIRHEELRDPKNMVQYVDNRTKGEGMYYLLFDEIQLLDRFEEVLNTYLKQANVDLYVTGSNARLLSKDVVTTFRGRGDEVRVRPLRFSEYLSAQPDINREQALRDYMIYGGLPQTVGMPTDNQKKEYLRGLFLNTYLLDIQERYNLKNDADLEELIDVIASNIGSLTNPHKLRNTFVSEKRSDLSTNTVKVYLDYLQDAFLIEKSVRYDIKGRDYIDTPYKYYFEDLGIRNARLNFRQSEPTHLMENLIYNELRVRGFSVDVGQVTRNTKTVDGKSRRSTLEVDFVCNKGFDRLYIQSAYALSSPAKRAQELAPLLQIRDGFEKMVVVGGLQPSYRTDEGILVINIFDFLLE